MAYSLACLFSTDPQARQCGAKVPQPGRFGAFLSTFMQSLLAPFQSKTPGDQTGGMSNKGNQGKSSKDIQRIADLTTRNARSTHTEGATGKPAALFVFFIPSGVFVRAFVRTATPGVLFNSNSNYYEQSKSN